MLTEWRVGYVSSVHDELSVSSFEWRSSLSLDSGYQRFHEYKAKYWDKDQLAALMLVRHDFDPMAGTFESTVLESLQKKLTPTVHYNKKDGLVKAKSKLQFTQGSLGDAAMIPAHIAPPPNSQEAGPVPDNFFEQFYNSQAMGTTNP